MSLLALGLAALVLSDLGADDVAPATATIPPDREDAPAVPPSTTLLRLDIEDGFALHPWVYREERLTERWGLLWDVQAQAPGANPRFPPYWEMDVGPVLHLGDLQVNPQLGLDVTYRDGPAGGQARFGDFIAQLYLLYADGRVAAESWNLYFFPLTRDGVQMYQTRNFVTVAVGWGIALGPHVEATWFRGTGTDRVAYGGDLSLSGQWGQVTIFLADAHVTIFPSDAGPQGRKQDRLESRLTFLRGF